jgi:hypothetical protein
MRQQVAAIRLIAFVTAMSLVPALLGGQTPKPFPNNGDLAYDGLAYADAYFHWEAIGGFQDPSFNGFELDIALGETYFDACTSWTNLPDPYDDCPTAGDMDPEGTTVFGIGSYCAGCIGAGPVYSGKWYFSGGSAASTYPNVTWAEVARLTCTQKSIWCYRTVQSSSLMGTHWRYNFTDFKEWYYAT